MKAYEAETCRNQVVIDSGTYNYAQDQFIFINNAARHHQKGQCHATIFALAEYAELCSDHSTQ